MSDETSSSDNKENSPPSPSDDPPNTTPPDSEKSKSSAQPTEEFVPSKVVSRAEWGALKPKWIEALQTPINKVAVSFTETDPCYTEDECRAFVKKLQEDHLAEEGVPDIKHNFLIGGDGVIYEGRGYTRVGPVYPPSPKKIEALNGCSIDIGIIERSSSESAEKVVKAISFAMSKGVFEEYIERRFHTMYIINNEIRLVVEPNETNTEFPSPKLLKTDK